MVEKLEHHSKSQLDHYHQRSHSSMMNSSPHQLLRGDRDNFTSLVAHGDQDEFVDEDASPTNKNIYQFSRSPVDKRKLTLRQRVL